MKPTFRCSSLDRALGCYGSTLLCSMVNKRQGDEGIEGTDIHGDGASRIIRELGASGVVGKFNPPSKNVTWISDYYVRLVRETVPSDWSIEVEVGIAYEFDRFILSCHPDTLALSPDVTEGMIFDLKCGYDPVDVAEQNWQLAGNAVLLKRAYPTLRKITVFLCQPRNDEDDGFPRVSSAVIENLDALVSDIEARLNTALDNQMEIEPSLTACKWCDAATQCPATIHNRDVMKLKLTPELLAKIKREPDDATLAQWVIAAKMLARPIEDAEKLAKERIEATGGITAPDGTRITQKVTRGSWTVPDPLAFFRALREMFPHDESIAKVTKPSMTRIKDEIADTMNIQKNSKVGRCAETEFQEKLAPLAVQGERRTFQFL